MRGRALRWGTRRRYPWYHGVTWRIHQSLVRRFPMKNMTTFEDVQCLPFEICQARRDAASLSFVGTSCAASLLKLSHVAKAWQWGFCHGRSPEWMVYFMSPNLKRMITGYIKYPHFRKHPLGHIVVVVSGGWGLESLRPMTCCHHWDIFGYLSSPQVGKRRCTRRKCLQNVRRIRCFEGCGDGWYTRNWGFSSPFLIFVFDG